MRANPNTARIIALAKEGVPNTVIAVEVGLSRQQVAAILRHNKVPSAPPARKVRKPIEVEWADHTIEVAGGHLLWREDGVHTSTGSGRLHYNKVRYSAAQIAYKIRTGRWPVGVVYAVCDIAHCIQLLHVADTATRQRVRKVVRRDLYGRQAPPESCRAGHKQAEHGRLSPDGISYCSTCRGARHKARKVTQLAA